MELGIVGKVALVVGGSKGMGRAICEHLARDRCRVVVVARQQTAIDETVEHLRSLGGEAVGVSVDITSPEGPKFAVDAALAAFGPPDIFVYNVEVGPGLSFDTATLEDYADLNRILVLSFVAVAQKVVPSMKEKRWGRIVTVSSAGVKQFDSTLERIADMSARHAAVAVSKHMANDLGRHGITVNTVGPGSVETEMHKHSMEERAKETGVPVADMRKILEDRVALRRLGTPEEFGAVCAFLCSNLAGFVTGQTILVDGGRYQGF